MTEQKQSQKIFTGAIIALSVILLAGAAALGIYIYQKTLKELEVRAKCPPSVIGVNQAHFTVTTRAVVSRIPSRAKVIDLWMPYPQNRTNQIISNVVVESPYPVEVNYDKKFGNAILHVRVKNPKKDFTVSIDFSLIRSENMAAKFIDRNVYKLKNAGDYATFLDSSGSGGAGLKVLAASLTKGRTTAIDKAKAIYDHVYRNRDKFSSGGTESPAGRFGALARVAGIPVRHIAGLVVRGKGEGRVSGQGLWVEFFAPGYGWLPADPETARKFTQDKDYYFGNTDEWRVELVGGSNLLLEPAQKGPPLAVWTGPYAEADGQVLPVGKETTWKREF